MGNKGTPFDNYINGKSVAGFMSRKITVRMLEATFNALPHLLRYVVSRKDKDLEARIALNNFAIDAKKERETLDPCDAIFGFAANIIRASEFQGTDEMEQQKILVSDLAMQFCKVHGLGTPEGNWTERLKIIPHPERK